MPGSRGTGDLRYGHQPGDLPPTSDRACDHMHLLIAAAYVRRHARTLLDNLDTPARDTHATALRAALNGTPPPLPDDRDALAARLDTVIAAAARVLDVIADPDLPNLLTYLGGRQEVRASLHTAATELDHALHPTGDAT